MLRDTNVHLRGVQEKAIRGIGGTGYWPEYDKSATRWGRPPNEPDICDKNDYKKLGIRKISTKSSPKNRLCIHFRK